MPQPQQLDMYEIAMLNQDTGQVRVYVVPARDEEEAKHRALMMLQMDLLTEQLVQQPTPQQQAPSSESEKGSKAAGKRPIGFTVH